MNATEQIKMLREALQANHDFHKEHDNYDGYLGSEIEEMNLKALAATEQPEAQEPEVKIKRFDVDGEFVLYRDHIAAIAALKQEQAGMARDAEQSWISVEDHLPEKFQEVMVFPSPTDYVMTAQLQGDFWTYGEYVLNFGHEWIKCNPTHWMPLPKPPAIAQKGQQ